MSQTHLAVTNPDGSVTELNIGSGFGAKAISQSDTVDDAGGPFRAFMISAEGAVKIKGLDDVDCTFASGHLAAKTIYQIGVKRVYDTGTDAITVYGIK